MKKILKFSSLIKCYLTSFFFLLKNLNTVYSSKVHKLYTCEESKTLESNPQKFPQNIFTVFTNCTPCRPNSKKKSLNKNNLLF